MRGNADYGIYGIYGTHSCTGPKMRRSMTDMKSANPLSVHRQCQSKGVGSVCPVLAQLVLETVAERQRLWLTIRVIAPRSQCCTRLSGTRYTTGSIVHNHVADNSIVVVWEIRGTELEVQKGGVINGLGLALTTVINTSLIYWAVYRSVYGTIRNCVQNCVLSTTGFGFLKSYYKTVQYCTLSQPRIALLCHITIFALTTEPRIGETGTDVCRTHTHQSTKICTGLHETYRAYYTFTLLWQSGLRS